MVSTSHARLTDPIAVSPEQGWHNVRQEEVMEHESLVAWLVAHEVSSIVVHPYTVREGRPFPASETLWKSESGKSAHTLRRRASCSIGMSHSHS